MCKFSFAKIAKMTLGANLQGTARVQPRQNHPHPQESAMQIVNLYDHYINAKGIKCMHTTGYICRIATGKRHCLHLVDCGLKYVYVAHAVVFS